MCLNVNGGRTYWSLMLSLFSSVVDCTGANPCLNGGICETDACTCATGFYGALCDTGIIVTYIKGHLTLKHNFTYAGSLTHCCPLIYTIPTPKYMRDV